MQKQVIGNIHILFYSSITSETFWKIHYNKTWLYIDFKNIILCFIALMNSLKETTIPLRNRAD